MKHKSLLLAVIVVFSAALLFFLSDDPEAMATLMLMQIRDMLLSTLIERFTNQK